MATYGGKREGAGRPKGSSIRPQIRDYFTEAEIQKLVNDLKTKYKSNYKIALFLAEQIFGKAPQQMELTGKDGKELPTPILYALSSNNSNQKDIKDGGKDTSSAGRDISKQDSVDNLISDPSSSIG